MKHEESDDARNYEPFDNGHRPQPKRTHFTASIWLSLDSIGFTNNIAMLFIRKTNARKFHFQYHNNMAGNGRKEVLFVKKSKPYCVFEDYPLFFAISSVPSHTYRLFDNSWWHFLLLFAFVLDHICIYWSSEPAILFHYILLLSIEAIGTDVFH